jgi:hypothetical protein
MLKEVGASGQISLGKKYAGQLFDLQTADDGSLKLTPVKVVPIAQETQAEYRPAPSSQQTIRQWAQTHAADIAQYNAWASENQPYSQRVRQWREQGESTVAQTEPQTEPRSTP